MITVKVEVTERKHERNLTYGDLFYWTNDNVVFGICMITYHGAVSLNHPTNTWSWKDVFQKMEENIRYNLVTLVPKGTKVIIEQQ